MTTISNVIVLTSPGLRGGAGDFSKISVLALQGAATQSRLGLKIHFDIFCKYLMEKFFKTNNTFYLIFPFLCVIVAFQVKLCVVCMYLDKM